MGGVFSRTAWIALCRMKAFTVQSWICLVSNIEPGYPCSKCPDTEAKIYRLNVILTTHRDERTAGASLTISHSN